MDVDKTRLIKSLLFLGVLVLIILIPCVICAKPKCSGPYKADSQETGRASFSTGGGYIAAHNGKYYFANPEDDNKLYEMDADFENKVKLSDHANASPRIEIRIVGNKLYYLQSDRTEEDWPPFVNLLYVYDLDTRTETGLSDENICSYTIYGERIYFSVLDTASLRSMQLDGSVLQVITEGVPEGKTPFAVPIDLHIYQSSLYDGFHEGLFARDLDSGNTAVLGPTYPYTLLLHKQYIYYIDFLNLGLRKLNIISFDDSKAYTEPKTKLLVKENVISFTIAGNRLYYATMDDAIYRTNLNGNGRRFIANGSNPLAIGGILFYFSIDGELMHIP
ncbi:MAG: DUF5050 domain-containing protein [Clostridiales bacterium]|nr:DUF5050 domain-containing protein [Clostridiales bacterium]